MAVAFLVYALCVYSGVCVESRQSFDSLFKRAVLILGVAAAQLMLAIELLSLTYALDGRNLFLVVAALTVLVVTFARRPVETRRESVRILLQRRALEARASGQDFFTITFALIGVAVFAVAMLFAWLLVPFNDRYHFELPLYWTQHRTIFPFAAHNARLTSLSFLSEALTLPGFLYARAERTPAFFTVVTGTLTLWSIFGLARRVGASLPAAVAATAVALGYTALQTNFLTAGAEMLLTGAFFGGSIIFLVDVCADRERFRKAELAASIFLFTMACGAKNSTTVLGPVYLIFFLVGCRRLFPDWPTFARRTASLVIVAGLTGLLCSGVAWNYTSNKTYFGKKGLPKIINDTVSRDYSPREVWTRMCRGAVLLVYDVTWVPKSLRPAYAALCEGTLKVLGAKKQLSEDTAWYAFRAEPMKGLGPLGALFFVPALVVASVRSVRGRKSHSTILFNTAALAALALAAFAMVHLVLRWQAIGVLRLMFPFIVAGAPLTALLLERKTARFAALGLLIMSAGMFVVIGTGHLSRRYNWSDGAIVKAISKLQNNRNLAVQYRWKEQPQRDLVMREDYTYREIYQVLIKDLKQPAIIGFVGDDNAETLDLFGKRFVNRVIPLVDGRTPEKLIDPGVYLDYVIAQDRFAETRDWAAARNFEEVFTCANGTNEMVIAFARKAKE